MIALAAAEAGQKADAAAQEHPAVVMCPCLLDGIGDVEAQTAAQIHRVGLGIRYIGHHVNGGVVRTLHRGGPGQLLRQSGDGLILCHAANVDAVDGGAVAQRITAAAEAHSAQ